MAVRRAAASFDAAPLHLLAGGANIWFGKTFGDGGDNAVQDVPNDASAPEASLFILINNDIEWRLAA